MDDTFAIHGLDIYAPAGVVSSRTQEWLETGIYETEEIDAAKAVLDPDLPVIELGAGLGVVSCAVNRMLKDPTQHLAVEMHPAALGVLEKNRKLNDCRFTPFLAALAYGAPVAAGAESGDRDSDDTEIWDPQNADVNGGGIPLMTLTEIADQQGWSRFNLVADIQGAELAIVENEPEVFERVSTISWEIHPHLIGHEKAAWLVARLRDYGLSLDAITEQVVSLGLRRH